MKHVGHAEHDGAHSRGAQHKVGHVGRVKNGTGTSDGARDWWQCGTWRGHHVAGATGEDKAPATTWACP